MNWLNENTPEYDEVLKRIESGDIITIWNLRSEYKISKAMQDKLQPLITKQLYKNLK